MTDYSEPTVYPNSWKTIVEKHSDSMANENPDHGWYYREHMENLAEELWRIIIMDRYEMCSCGHFGGSSPKEQHLPRFQKGHGSCNHCNCEQFTWVGFCDEDGNILS